MIKRFKVWLATRWLAQMNFVVFRRNVYADILYNLIEIQSYIERSGALLSKQDEGRINAFHILLRFCVQARRDIKDGVVEHGTSV
jgi:hypothetical protein